ncbi:MAG: ATP-dependent Clp protease ATP-binding subunit [Candidatus Levybacteria bacterium]|nr:ATP-dependent Clp protease ATP-binding subunit [Candidatus Levybacteria bacterium]
MQPTLRNDLSVLTHLDTRTTAVLQQAEKEAQRLQLQLMMPEQLLYGLLCDAQIFDLLQTISADAANISQKLQQTEQAGTYTAGQPTLSEDVLQIIEKAYTGAKNRDAEFITPEDLFMTMFTQAPTVTAFLSAQGITKEKITEKLDKSTEYVTGKKSVLDKFGIDLTQEARDGKLDPITGRDKEIERLIHIMLRRTKNNPIIIGEAGVGKTAIVEGMAQKIVAGDVPKDLLDKHIFMLDLAAMVAGASHRGEFEERLRGVIKETQLSAGKIILFIDEIHTLIGAGDSGGAMDASNIIKPYLARGQLQIIGTTTTAEYRRYFEKDKAFERRFQSITADEPSEEVAIAMLKVLRPKYEKFHHVSITDEAIEAAVKLSKKYIGERYLPDKAIDLLDEAAAEVKLKAAGLSHDVIEEPKKEKETIDIPKEAAADQKVVPAPPDVAVASNGIVTPLPVQQPVQPVQPMPIQTSGGAQMQPQAGV